MIQRKIAYVLREISNRLDLIQTSPPKPTFKHSPMIYTDLDTTFKDLYDQCIDFTKTTVERLYAQFTAINYIVAAGIPGAIVECGIWRGGSSMMSAMRLKELGDTDRMLYLYDTYAGMSEPTVADISFSGDFAVDKWKRNVDGEKNLWAYASLEEVQKNLRSTKYPLENIRFVKGKVENTITRDTLPGGIAFLRLDTDWYESTYHELVHLYPLLVPGGVMIIDDYGHWHGARKAVDQYIEENGLSLYLHRIDYSGRVTLKLDLNNTN